MPDLQPLSITSSQSIELTGKEQAIAACAFEREGVALCDKGGALSLIQDTAASIGFRGESGETALVHTCVGDEIVRVVLAGLGPRSEFTASVMKHAAAAAARVARNARATDLQFILPPGDPALLAREVVEGAITGLYENGFYKAKDDDAAALSSLNIVAGGTSGAPADAIREGQILGEAINWARSLADEPGANLPPSDLARRAAAMAEEFGLSIESLDAGQVREKGMGGLWGVGKGSAEPPCVIVLRYEPPGAAGELWAYVGKGITFDTGGISIKHGLEMYEMKADMAGGASVLGAMRAIAQLRPDRRIAAIVPAAENMPSGNSIKPGDVVTTLAGFTIECVDTDAEGRMIMADGLAYAVELGADRIVDLATLTGSIVSALGDVRSGLFSNDDEWAAQVMAACDAAGERAWRMPVSEDYKKKIESDIADFKNYGGRPDATAAALLLSKFTDGRPWAHLDIAGTSWLEEEQPYAVKGASGVGVRMLVELACRPFD